jgi:Mg-chelatase subunit ChlD
MRFDIASRLDGEGIKEVGRPDLDICFVIDVSGSMQSPFPNDTDNRSKLNVAISCVCDILYELTSNDRVSVIEFNTNQKTIINPTYATDQNKEIFKTQLQALKSSGGTDLARGLQAGMTMLKDSLIDNVFGSINKLLDNSSNRERSKRVMFLTDMMSSSEDERKVIDIATNAVTTTIESPIYLSLVGIGVDLSANTVECISSIPGARYISAMNSAEFKETIVSEFAYDVTPIAFNIRISLPSSLQYQAAYGSSELNSLSPGSSLARISSEFPNPLNSDGSVAGGVIIFHLNELEYSQGGLKTINEIDESIDLEISNDSINNNNITEINDPRENSLLVQWCDRNLIEHKVYIPLDIPSKLEIRQENSSGCDEGLRKSIALLNYVNILTKYSLEDDDEDYYSDESDESNLSILKHQKKLRFDNLSKLTCSAEVKDLFKTISITDFISQNINAMHILLPSSLLRSHNYINKFINIKDNLYKECTNCNDVSLTGINQNIIETIDQIIDLETKELEASIKNLKTEEEILFNEEQLDKAIHGFKCPISLNIMDDPVIACDGHSYERNEIEKWFKTNTTSPVTNIKLDNKILIENHALRSAIDDYICNNDNNNGI